MSQVSPKMTVLETTRLRLREITAADAAFIYKLLNDSDFLKYVGDRGIDSLDDARRHIADGPQQSYRAHGFGLWLVELATGGVATGVCGLLQRDYLPVPDLGFAYLPAYRRRGIGCEAASAVLELADTTLGLERVQAITSPANGASVALLQKLGFRLVDVIEPNGPQDPVQLYQRIRPATATTDPNN